MSRLFEIAEKYWAEDEAYSLIVNWEDALENGYTIEEINEGVQKDIDHMLKVFSSHDDADDLIARFKAKVHEKYPSLNKN